MDEHNLLKKTIDEELYRIRMTEGMKEKIRSAGGCKETVPRPAIKIKRCRKIGIIAIALVLAFSGTVVAMSYVLGLDLYFGNSNLERATKERIGIHLSDEENGVRLVVEEAMIQQYSSIIAFSFINETNTPWPEDITCNSLDINTKASVGQSKGILSEDGKRLTYYLEGYSEQDMNNLEASLEATNLVTNREIEESIEIPIGEVYERQGARVDYKDYEFTLSSEPFEKLMELINKRENQETIILDSSYPSVSLVGAGFLGIDKKSAEKMGRGTNGLVLFIRNDEYTSQTNWGEDTYLNGGISEVVDTRTGEVYTATQMSMFSDSHQLKGEIKACYFPNIEESTIPYLKATKAAYIEQQVIAEGEWQVDFVLEENKNMVKLEPNLSWENGNEEIYIDEAYISALGVQLKIRNIDKTTKEIKGSIEQEIEIELIDKKGIRFNIGTGGSLSVQDKEGNLQGVILSYSPYDENENRSFLEVENINTIIINGHEVPIT